MQKQIPVILIFFPFKTDDRGVGVRENQCEHDSSYRPAGSLKIIPVRPTAPTGGLYTGNERSFILLEFISLDLRTGRIHSNNWSHCHLLQTKTLKFQEGMTSDLSRVPWQMSGRTRPGTQISRLPPSSSFYEKEPLVT